MKSIQRAISSRTLRCLGFLLASFALSSVDAKPADLTVPQPTAPIAAATPATTEPAESTLSKIWGNATPEPMIALGMWTYHLKHESADMDNSRNDLLGFSYKGWFAATLINSENRRSYAAGVQRYWLTEKLSPDVTYQLGYRLGLIHGYDKKLGRYAAHTPVVPFPQIISDLTWKHFGWEISYTWVVLSTSFYIRF